MDHAPTDAANLISTVRKRDITETDNPIWQSPADLAEPAGAKGGAYEPPFKPVWGTYNTRQVIRSDWEETFVLFPQPTLLANYFK